MIEHQNALERAAAETLLEEMPTEVVMNDITETTTQLAESADEIGEISRNVDDLGAAAVSVESFVNNFMNEFTSESWTPRLAQQYQMGMDAVLATAGVYVPASIYAASFEAAGVTQTNEENRKETVGKSDNVIKRLWVSFMQMIDDLWDRLQTFMALLGKSSDGIRKSASNLKSRVSQLGDKPANSTKLSGKFTRYLKAGEKKYSNPVEALKDVQVKGFGASREWYDSYLKAAQGLAGRNFAELANGTEGDALEQITSLLTPKLKEYDGSWPSVKEIKFDRVTGTEGKLETFKITLSRESSGEATVMSTAQVLSVSEELVHIAGGIDSELKRFNKGKAEITTIKNKVSNLVKSGQKSQDPNALKAIGYLLSSLMTGPRTILPIVGSVAVDAYTHADQSLKQLSKGAGAAKKDKDGDHEMR